MQTNKTIIPAQTIGIIGGGQLGRMMAMEARYMGYKIAVLDPTPNCPTAQVADVQITAPYDDMDAIKQLTDISDVITYEFENVDLEAATYIESKGKLPQGAYALEVTQNREKEKTLMRNLNLSTPRFAIVRNAEDCKQILKGFTYPAVIKTCRGGYDGKGQLKLNSEADLEEALDFAEKNGHCIIEDWITFDKEISVIFTRSVSGDMTYFPISENEHRQHILYKTTVPADINLDLQLKANEAARILAEDMNIVGTFAIEMFVKGDEIYLNEMAPRPHNSGHYTIEACNISQFGQHIRAICGLPLVKIRQLKPAIMVNILGENMKKLLQVIPKNDVGFVHLYGKEEAKEKRKMGHITFIGDTLDEILAQMGKFKEAIHK
ncbi:5-(carboxyamino)imidazole ribonucleotide synthase [Oceanobacillus sp. Castelsardo]|uniref:5-(carboxyamino)imidazole ribonucleotide synthase n=1 Tax=Oceanobacillus sp. Castelsardo TaxID=1851204 RepID=UPI0008383CA8|nr:5-(carboxyamino)imidazole ribonucleotide synthase [Oceanobacillus sp. Castelsardo]